MAKNITIREGDTSKQFTAKKLKVNLVGGGTANFIPEDEALDYVDVKDHEFKVNGTFNPSDFNCDAFGQVKVSIPADVKPKTITANGEFYAADDGCAGYSKVTVAVPGGGGGGPFTVRFFDDDGQTILKTDTNVPYGGSASCTLLDGTVVGGEYFKGWNPAPVNVKENMNCYPIRGEYVLDPNEIQDSWETICADGGAHYPLGSYKSLVLDVDVAQGDVITEYQDSYNGVLVPYRIISAENRAEALRLAFHMVKVAEGEDNSRSTWLSTGCPIFTSNMNFIYQRWDESSQEWVQTATQTMPFYLAAVHCHNIGTTHPMRDWSTGWIRGFLRNMIFNKLPNVLKDTIKTVTKKTYGYSTMYADATRVEKETLDQLWVPSMKELETLFSSYTPYTADCYPSAFNEVIEHSGIDYSRVYVPTYPTAGAPAAFITRTMVSHISTGVISMWLCGNSANNQYGSWQRFGGQTSWFPIGFCL